MTKPNLLRRDFPRDGINYATQNCEKLYHIRKYSVSVFEKVVKSWQLWYNKTNNQTRYLYNSFQLFDIKAPLQYMNIWINEALSEIIPPTKSYES